MIETLIIIFAKYLIGVISLLAFFFFLFQKKDIKKKMIIFAGFILPVIFLISRIASLIYYNPRPFVLYNFKPLIQHAADNGFPSDHALLSFAIAFFVFVFNKKLGMILISLGFIVGFSRVMAGVHSPIDILGSFVISASVTCVVYIFLRRKYL